MRSFIGWIGAILGLSFLIVGSVYAQNAPSAYCILLPPSPRDFPLLQPMLKVYTAQGRFIHGLSPSEIQLYENGIEVSLQEIKEQRVGVQVVFVLNPGEVFLLRDAQGFTRYDYLMDGLVDWARRRLGSTIDDLSIVVTDGPSRSHLTNPLELFYTLASYRVPRDATPSLDALLRGIEIAADPSPREGMERIVLLITAPLSGDQTVAIENAIQQAQQNGVRVYIWYLTTPITANPQAISALQPLAEGTQGTLWVLTKPDEQPDPETIFEPLRNVYALRYLASPGLENERRLEVEVKIGETAARSQPITFRTNIQPPNVIFIAPPVEILRQPPESNVSISTSPEEFEPQTVRLNLLVEFPDGRPRSIVKMRVYVDDQLIHDQLEPPFDGFTWDLRPYTQSGQHVLQVEIVDEFGMTAKTVATPILVKINRALPTPSKIVGRNIPLIGLSLSAFIIAFIVLVMAMRGQLLPASQRLGRRLGTQKKQVLDPLTQPVSIPPLEPPKKRISPTQETQTPTRSVTEPPVFAHLFRLGKSDLETSGPFAVVTEELPIGSDALKNLLVIDDPTVASTHARLERQPDGSFRLHDLGSLMGTWVNYTPVSQEGVLLRDGDLVHIGRVGFRFRLREMSLKDRPALNREEKL